MSGRFTPTDTAGYCGISSDGEMSTSSTVAAGTQTSTGKINYVGGKVSTVISIRQ